jgi:hypothetical protein
MSVVDRCTDKGPEFKSDSLIDRSGSGAFKLSTTTMLMSLAALRFFSNPPFGVKRFQNIHHYNVDVACGLALSSESAPRPFHHGQNTQLLQSKSAIESQNRPVMLLCVRHRRRLSVRYVPGNNGRFQKVDQVKQNSSQ